MSRVEVRVLGGFEVSVDGRRVPGRAWQHRRASELVKLLALAPRHRLQREQIIDALWPDLPPDAGAANLRKAAHHARAALGSKEAVVLRQAQVSLWPHVELAVDADRFETEGKLALRTGAAEACAGAAAGYRGELLPDQRYEDGPESAAGTFAPSMSSCFIVPGRGSRWSPRSRPTNRRTVR